MTAIADIIVNPSAQQQKPDLQVSQNLNLSNQSSSNTVSFAQMLDAMRSESMTDKMSLNERTEVEKSADSQTEKYGQNDRYSEKSKASEAGDSKPADDKVSEKPADSSVNNAEKTENAEKNAKVSDGEPKNKVSDKNQKELLAGIKNNSEKASSAKANDSQKNQKQNQLQAKQKTAGGKKEGLDEEYNKLNQLVNWNTEDKAGLAAAKVGESKGDNLVKVDSRGFDGSQEADDVLIEAAELTGKSGNVSEFGIKFKDFESENGKISKLDKDGKITVKDLRKQPVEEKASDIKPKNNLKLDANLEINDKNTATITMELNGQNAENNILSLNNQAAAGDNSNFQAMLSNQIQQNAPEFVKAGSIILKDNDQGTINLVLHPDDLGSVKIHLSLDGKTISANITVNTKEALEVFKDNAQTLREAFAQNGFDTSNFDVSYNNPNGNANSNAQQDFENRFDNSDFLARRAYEDFGADDNSGMIQNDDYFANYSEYSVNIVA